MLVDARTLSSGDDITADLCIVGGGAAGISIARTLDDSGIKIALIESGSETFDEATQSLYAGNIVGKPYPVHPDLARLRYFGGSTNHWGGTCWPLDAADFSPKSWVPDSGWPISFADVAPYLDRATELCELPSPRFGRDVWSPEMPPLPDLQPGARLDSDLWPRILG